MSQFKKTLASFLALGVLFTAGGCAKHPADVTDGSGSFTNRQDTVPQNSVSVSGDPIPTEEPLSPTDPLQQTEPVPEAPETVASIFNSAVALLESAQSYTMTGSVGSTSDMGEISSTVVTSIDCRYEKTADGGSHMLMTSRQTFEQQDFDHSTYYVGSTDSDTYYISALGTKYFVDTNDFGDFYGQMYLNQVQDASLADAVLQQVSDGTAWQLSFTLPYGTYASEALDGWLGGLTDGSVLQKPLTVRALITEDGVIDSLYLSVETVTEFGSDTILQTVIVSLHFEGYNTTTVLSPTDLDTYEDRTGENDFDPSHDGQVGILSPEDVD